MFSSLISGLTSFIGPTATGIVVPAVEGAGAGALSTLLTGGNMGKNALVGGLTGGAIGAFGGSDGALAQYLGLSGPQANALIGAGVGGLGNYAMGQNPLTGAALGGIGGYAYGSTGYGAADPYSYGGDPKAGGSTAPATGVTGGTSANGWTDVGGTTAPAAATAAGQGGGALGASSAGASKGINTTALALGALAALGSATSKPQQGTWATPGPASVATNLGPTWNQGLTSAPGRTATPAPFAGNSPNYWSYGGPEQSYFSGNSLKSYGFAEGGALSHRLGYADGGEDEENEFSTANGERHVNGPGDGTSDSVPARLATGEYVLTAQEVALLGQGDNKAGAKKLDAFRDALKKKAGAPKFLPPHLDRTLNRLAPAAGDR